MSKIKTLKTLAVLALMACSEPAPAPSIEATPQALTAEQELFCQRLERRGEATPWWCGRKEGLLAPPFADACPDRQWIGYRLEAGMCPEATSAEGTWEVEEPYAQSGDARLRRLCRYTWSGAGAPDVAVLPDQRSIRMERDCEVVAGHAVPQPVADTLFGAWSDQVELPDWSSAEAFATPRVRVAVIDAGEGGESPTGAGPEVMSHATMVSSVVRAITCPERGGSALCAAGVPNYRAMPYIAPGVEGELGGYFGTQEGFASAVVDAVDTWRQEPAATRPARLVLNLSLGWDGAFDVTNVQRIPGAAALWAVQYAACEGALMIAAAGNRAAGSDAGPLFPAAWEQLPRACGGPAGVYSPLVHAVGAVDGRDAPLALTRAGGTPRLVAPAAVVVVPKDTALPDDEPSVVLSGTSVAAASASGAAALVWSLRPGLAPDTVMDVLYRAGQPLGVPAQFGLNGQLAQRRRLSVARAFTRACPVGVAVGACPAAQSRPILPAPRAAGVDAQADFANIVETLLANPVDAEEDLNPVEPDLLSHLFAPYVIPQPGEPNCPICGFVGTTLHGELGQNLADATLGLPKVRIVDTLGNPHTIGLAALPYGVTFKVDLTNKLAGISIKTALLEIPVILNGKAVLTSSELFVD